jgi:hypothetical protein
LITLFTRNAKKFPKMPISLSVSSADSPKWEKLLKTVFKETKLLLRFDSLERFIWRNWSLFTDSKDEFDVIDYCFMMKKIDLMELSVVKSWERLLW